MVLEIRASMTDVAIGRCWVKSKLLALAYETEVNEQFGRMENESETEKGNELVAIYTKVTLEVNQPDPFYERTSHLETESEVCRWLHIQSKIDVREPLTENALQDSKKDQKSDILDRDFLDSDNNEKIAAALPSVELIIRRLQDLEKMAVDSMINGAVYDLRFAHQIFLFRKP